MRVQFLRRRKLGFGSCKGMVQYMQEAGLDASVVRNDRGVADAPIVIRWGCTSNTSGNNIIINPSEGIHRVNNKAAFRMLLQDEGVSVPTSYFSKADTILPILGGSKLIGRPAHHSQGKWAVVCETEEDVRRDNTSDYWSIIIPKEREYRVYCFFGLVIAVAEKVPNDPAALLWNRAQNGSIFHNVRWSSWPINSIKEALKVHKLSRCDFEGIDVMEYQGRPYILESNSAPSMSTEYRKQCFAKGFTWVHNYIAEQNVKPPHYDIPSGDSYRHFIHPAIG
ncbi:MAG: hypothetical protein WDA47_05265 [Bacilli bacterium]